MLEFLDQLAQRKTSPEAKVSGKNKKCLPVPNVDKAEIQIDICRTSNIPGKESQKSEMSCPDSPMPELIPRGIWKKALELSLALKYGPLALKMRVRVV